MKLILWCIRTVTGGVDDDFEVKQVLSKTKLKLGFRHYES